ncbi:P-loop containing nucleoside triphosphate hydrolase protein [Blastocladiella britannica]|nr:P-loop containing nucleoside triphosphate hydrolase protein [Blastocladiella britannica]
MPSASTVLSVTFLFRVLAMLLTLHTYLRVLLNADQPLYFALFVSGLALSVLALVLSSLDQGRGSPNDVAENSASPFSKVTFSWILPMLFLARKQRLTMDNISDTNKLLRMERLEKLRREVTHGKSKGHLRLIINGVLSKYWPLVALSLLSSVASLAAAFVSPRLLLGLLDFVDAYSPLAASGTSKPPVSDGLVFAIGMFLMSVLGTMGETYADQLNMGLQSRIQGMIQSGILRKALALPLSELKESSVSEIITCMSTEAEDLADGIKDANNLWLFPLTFSLSLYFLYSQIGWAAFVGLTAFVVIAPVNYWTGIVGAEQMEIKTDLMERRTDIVKEMILCMKRIKLLVFEDFFRNKILSTRAKEEASLHTQYGTLAFYSSIANIQENLVTLLCFFTYALISPPGSMTPSLVFVSLAYIGILLRPLSQAMRALIMFTNAKQAYHRINEFLDLEELGDRVTRSTDAASPVAVKIADASLKWGVAAPRHQDDALHDETPSLPEKPVPVVADNGDDDDSDSSATAAARPRAFSLTNLSLDILRGALVAVVGRVGTGKSSLLHGILGELDITAGSIELHGSVAYAPQHPWILNASIRDNITVGHEFDLQWFTKVVDACALTHDLEGLSEGDLTFVGDKGVNLSGGQKARIGLARAVYADRDIVLLDDCLSAVDAHVDRAIFNKVLGPNGLLHAKTVILVTHGTHHLAQCDHVVLLKDGTIAEQGPLEQVIEMQGDVYRLLVEFSTKTMAAAPAAARQQQQQQQQMSQHPRSLLATARLFSQLSLGGADDDVVATVSADHDAELVALLAQQKQQQQQQEHQQQQQQQAKRDDDDMGTGGITWDVYQTYLKACGIRYYAYMVPLFIMCIAVASFQSDWLESMSSAVAAAKTRGKIVDLVYYIGIYAAFTLTNLFTLFGIGYIGMNIMAAHASRKLHTDLLNTVMRASMSWYDMVPAGRILTRFSTDIDTLDVEIPTSLMNFVLSAGMILSTMLILSISSPWVLVLYPFGAMYLYQVAQLYLNASRDLGRLQLATQAPVYQKVEESLHGLVSVRALGHQPHVTADIAAAMDRSTRLTYLTPSLSRWLELSTSMLASCFILCIGLVAVLTRGTALSGYIGLGMTQAQALTWKFNALIVTFCRLETKMVSVERIQQYSQVPPEAPADSDFVMDADKEWPAHGKIEFKEYWTTYRSDLEPALTDLSIAIPAGCKVGVVGRTGAGKSSLTLALFRIIEATSGCITLDGVDIAKVGLRQLRSQLCIIPQDPMLFKGTIRDNLDPLNQHDDAALWRALELADMSEYVSGLEGKLLGEVAHAGSNFSAGQKQLITLASAILRKRKVVIFDEATSATDAETDAVVQRTIRQEFKDCTILTIAHRINTIRDSDRILVLDKGQVAEYDAPETLLGNPKSLFAQLVRDSESYSGSALLR